MKLVKAKCATCGGNLDVNPEAEVLVCKYCGTPFIVEKAIHNYNTSITNNTINNINAENVIINQGKNIDALIARGKTLVDPIRIKEIDDSEPEEVVELRRIAREILEQDYNNFYGHFFMIASDDTSSESYSVCENITTEEEQNVFVKYLEDRIDWQITLLDSITEDLAHLQIKTFSESDVLDNVWGLQEMANKCESGKLAYENTLVKINKTLENVTKIATNKFITFFFSKENIKSYKFEKLCTIVNELCLIYKLLDDVIHDKTSLYVSNEQIYTIVNRNKTSIMLYNPIYGASLIKDAYKISGKTLNEKETSEITKVVVRGLRTSSKPTTLTLYNDKIIVEISGEEERIIHNKDILVLNSQQVVVSSSMQMLRTTLWYDLVYRLSNTTYTLLHFGYDMAAGEDFYNCQVYSSISAWSIQNNINKSETEFHGVNPFANGYNGLSFINTQPETQGCYVATCVYGSYDCPQVWTLRRYRDYYLDTRWWGKIFIKLYYSISPKLVKAFGKTKWFNRINKRILDKKIQLLKDKGYLDTSYDDKY